MWLAKQEAVNGAASEAPRFSMRVADANKVAFKRCRRYTAGSKVGRQLQGVHWWVLLPFSHHLAASIGRESTATAKLRRGILFGEASSRSWLGIS